MNTNAASDAMARALEEIEIAQRHLEKACQALCPVRGASGRWRRVGKLALKVQNEWHALDGWTVTADGLSLDSEEKP